MIALLIYKFLKMQNAYLKDLVIQVRKEMSEAEDFQVVEKVVAIAKCAAPIFDYEEDELRDAVTELVDNFCKN